MQIDIAKRNRIVMAANQPNFWPSLSFWHKLYLADVFVILDDAQFSTNNFHHRQRVRHDSEQGYQWMHIPVEKKRDKLLNIKIKTNHIIKEKLWYEIQLDYLQKIYHKAPYFQKHFPAIQKIYRSQATSLTDFNLKIINYVIETMEINTIIVKSSEIATEIQLPGSQRLVELCKLLQIKHYLSGQGAKSQRSFNANDFYRAGIGLSYIDFKHPTYNQQHKPFIANMGCLDSIFCTDDLQLPVK